MIAFFPGKFQPPHIGHISTISKLLLEYDKIIIGISEDEPHIVSYKDIVSLFHSIFIHVGSRVLYEEIKGKLTDKDRGELFLPYFDVLVSGNRDVVKWGKKNKFNTRFFPRTEGYLCSGTDIRRLNEGE